MPDAVLLYLRVSSEEQGKGNSIAHQRDVCLAHCERMGYHVAGECVDEHTSETAKRPAMERMFDRLAEGGIAAVVSWRYDRLRGRGSEFTQQLIKHQILRAGARIEYAQRGTVQTPDEPDDDIVNLIDGWVAREENRKRREAIIPGMRKRAESGQVLGGGYGPPFGYRYISEPRKGRLEIDEDEATVVRDMYRWLVDEGLSTYLIAKRLHERAVPTRLDRLREQRQREEQEAENGDEDNDTDDDEDQDTEDEDANTDNPALWGWKRAGETVWAPTSVKRILTNPAYVGRWTFGTTRRIKRPDDAVKPDGTPYKTQYAVVPTDPSEWIVVEVPEIVDEDIWERAQEQLATNKRYAKKPKHIYLLRGMLYCVCGHPRQGNAFVTEHGKRHAVYRCARAGNDPWRADCNAGYGIKQYVVEQRVWDYVMARLLNREKLMEDVERHQREEAGQRAKLERELRNHKTDLADVDRQLTVLLDDAVKSVLSGFPAEVVEARRAELVSLRERHVAEISRLRTRLDQHFDAKAADELVSAIAAKKWHHLSDLRDQRRVEEQRTVLRQLRLRVDVVDKETVKVSGILSPAFLNVNSSSPERHFLRAARRAAARIGHRDIACAVD